MNKEQFIKLAVQSGYGKEEAAREYTEANDKAEYDTDDFILSGLEITGTLVKPQKQISVLPYEYINQDDNGEYVNIFSKGVIDKKYIETGIETESDVEIKTQFPLNTVFVKNNGKGNTLIEHFD